MRSLQTKVVNDQADIPSRLDGRFSVCERHVIIYRNLRHRLLYVRLDNAFTRTWRSRNNFPIFLMHCRENSVLTDLNGIAFSQVKEPGGFTLDRQFPILCTVTYIKFIN